MTKKIFRKIWLFLCVTILSISLTSCAWFDNEIKNIKGELVGNDFTIDFYDNFGSNILTIYGDKVGVQANYVETDIIDSEGSTSTSYELSSVITITVDGNEVDQTGNTIIFAEKGIKKLEDFSLSEEISSNGGTINIVDRNINKLKNILGTPKVIVICSQLGVPIAVYGGDSVYWEIPDDLPKTTKLNIDGRALYVHRANYILLDKDMIE